MLDFFMQFPYFFCARRINELIDLSLIPDFAKPFSSALRHHINRVNPPQHPQRQSLLINGLLNQVFIKAPSNNQKASA
jgi:hypothetical protein